jgi:hypothetical protein
MRLQFRLGQSFSEQLEVSILEGNRVIPDLGRNINRRVQML